MSAAGEGERAAPDFANILFAGPCNRRCPYCIGKELPERVNVRNLELFPPRNLEAFIAEVNRLGIRQIVFTGTVTDPQLYRYEEELLGLLRERIETGAEYALHTNGALALRKLSAFNAYDRVCISFPSFERATYARHMGSPEVPDLAAIVAASRVPVKVSCVLDHDNVPEIPEFLVSCRAIGVRRVVLRKLHGETRDWNVVSHLPVRGWYRNNPVHDFDGMEVTCWDFARSESTSLNLFADGTLGTSYLLARTPELLEPVA